MEQNSYHRTRSFNVMYDKWSLVNQVKEMDHSKCIAESIDELV